MGRCIAPGCTSGYDSNKIEKVHFFNVPKDETRRKHWQDALKRNDLDLKPSHQVCMKHFRQEEIMTFREIKGPDGSILGIVCVTLYYVY